VLADIVLLDRFIAPMLLFGDEHARDVQQQCVPDFGTLLRNRGWRSMPRANCAPTFLIVSRSPPITAMSLSSANGYADPPVN
jgi:hypothetical protein